MRNLRWVLSICLFLAFSLRIEAFTFHRTQKTERISGINHVSLVYVYLVQYLYFSWHILIHFSCKMDGCVSVCFCEMELVQNLGLLLMEKFCSLSYRCQVQTHFDVELCFEIVMVCKEFCKERIIISWYNEEVDGEKTDKKGMLFWLERIFAKNGLSFFLIQ